jgi:hypothetical protein
MKKVRCVTIEDFLYDAADRLRNGDFLLPESVLPIIEESRETLETMACELEDSPSPQGLEAIDEAMLEAFNLFAEALDLLELAVEDGIPELAPEILSRTQDARETLREVRRQAETHNQTLQEESGFRG